MCHRTFDMVFGKLRFFWSNSLCSTKITSINLEKYNEELIYSVIGCIFFSSYVLICTVIKYCYFLIRTTQKKIALFVFNSNSKRDKENSSILLVESSSLVKLRYSTKHYILLIILYI